MFGFAAGVLVLLGLLGVILWQQREIARLKLEGELWRIRSERPSPRHVTLPAPPSPATPPPTAETAVSAADGNAALESAIEAWLVKVGKLRGFLREHPEWSIAQLELLAPADWLDATKKPLESEADLRRALGSLRGLARQKTASDIAKALRAATAANGGQAPGSVETLLSYLPAGFDPALLSQVMLNPSGAIPGLREIGGGATTYYLVDRPVDPLWDGTLFYDASGGYGSRSSSARGENDVANAIAQFRAANNGAAPTNVSQLLGDPKVAALDPTTLEELFRAMTTSVAAH